MKQTLYASAGALACCSGIVLAEPDIPPPAAFVAAIEFSIAVCSSREPELATQYAATRKVAASLFAKGNYDSYIGKEAYGMYYEKLGTDLKATPETEISEHCSHMLLLNKAPPQGIFYRE